MTATIEQLQAAGATLAAVASPDKDLLSFAGDFDEIAATLKLIGGGLGHACEQAEDTHFGRYAALAARNLWNIAERREWTRDEIDLARDNEIKQARDTAKRTAQRALVDLARLIGELEAF